MNHILGIVQDIKKQDIETKTGIEQAIVDENTRHITILSELTTKLTEINAAIADDDDAIAKLS